MALKDWSTTAASNSTSGTGVACDEGQQAGTVNNGVRELMAQVKTALIDAEWLQRGDSITYLSATEFQVGNISDETIYAVGRRVRVTGTLTGTIYGTISSYTVSAPNINVTVAFDSGSMSNEALEVEPGILSPASQSIPTKFTSDTEFTGDVDLQATTTIGSGGTLTINGALNLGASLGLIRGASIVTDTTRAASSGGSPFTLANIAYTKNITGPLVVVAAIGVKTQVADTPAYFQYDTAGQASGSHLAETFALNEFIKPVHISYFASVSAGAQSLVVSARRAAGAPATMNLVYNPNNSADGSALPATTMSHYLFLEL